MDILPIIRNMINESYKNDQFSKINRKGLSLSGQLQQDVSLFFDEKIEFITYDDSNEKKDIIQLIYIDEFIDFELFGKAMNHWAMLNDLLTHEYGIDIAQPHPDLKIEIIMIGEAVDVGLSHFSMFVQRNNRMKIRPYSITLDPNEGISFIEETYWGFDPEVNEVNRENLKVNFLKN